jgi:hypothetical protein
VDERMNKKGISTMFLLYGIIFIFFGVVLLIVFGTVITNMNTALDQNVTIGQVNLKTINEGTFGQFNTMVVNNADWWGTALIFGMVLALFLVSYFTRNSFPKIGIIFDMFLIFATFILSLYLSAAYSTLVTALTSAGQTFAEVNLTNTSFFILNLPLFTAVIGVVMMVLFHSGIPRRPEESRIISKIVA